MDKVPCGGRRNCRIVPVPISTRAARWPARSPRLRSLLCSDYVDIDLVMRPTTSTSTCIFLTGRRGSGLVVALLGGSCQHLGRGLHRSRRLGSSTLLGDIGSQIDACGRLLLLLLLILRWLG